VFLVQALMREHMRHTDRAMSHLESMPEGFNALRRMFETVQVGGLSSPVLKPVSCLTCPLIL
jgi:hypothetical protein